MRCIYCSEKSGFLKKTCSDCTKLVDILKNAPNSFGYRSMLQALIDTGVKPEKIESFLHADIDGTGSINDQITARMTNQVMTSLGQPSHMTSQEVKQVRKDIADGKPPSLMDQEVIGHTEK